MLQMPHVKLCVLFFLIKGKHSIAKYVNSWILILYRILLCKIMFIHWNIK